MSEQLKQDLRYWSDKLEYAKTLSGEKGENMRNVCRAMLDLYLDMYLKLTK